MRRRARDVWPASRTWLITSSRRTSRRWQRAATGWQTAGCSATPSPRSKAGCSGATTRSLSCLDTPTGRRRSRARTAARFHRSRGVKGLDARLLAERAIPQVESCLERADGTPITVLESAAIVPTPADLTEAGGDREIIERLVVDMSGSSALEGRLRQARRLEEVGTLATAMAPDIVALIRAIEETGAQISADLSAKDAQQARLDKIRTRATRAAESRPSARGVQPPAGASAATGRPQRGRRSRRADAHAAGGPARRFRNPPRQGRRRRCERGQSRAAAHDARGLGPRPAAGRRLARPRNDAPRLRAIRPGDGPVGPGVLLSVSASGYGVQPVQQAIAVEVVARRCGGDVRMTGEPGRRAALQVYFTRCGPAQPARAIVKKSPDRSGVSAEHWSAIPD